MQDCSWYNQLAVSVDPCEAAKVGITFHVASDSLNKINKVTKELIFIFGKHLAGD